MTQQSSNHHQRYRLWGWVLALMGVVLIEGTVLVVWKAVLLPASGLVIGLIAGILLSGAVAGWWLTRGHGWNFVLWFAGATFVFSLWLLGLWLSRIVWAETDVLQRQQCIALPEDHAALLISWPAVLPVGEKRSIRFEWVTGFDVQGLQGDCQVVSPQKAGSSDDDAVALFVQKEILLVVALPPELDPAGWRILHVLKGEGAAILEVRNRGTVEGFWSRVVTLEIQTEGQELTTVEIRLEPSSLAALRFWVLGLDQRTPIVAVVGAVLSALVGVFERYSQEKERLREKAIRWKEMIERELKVGEVEEAWRHWRQDSTKYLHHLEEANQEALREVFHALGNLKEKQEVPLDKVEKLAANWPKIMEEVVQKGWFSTQQWGEVIAVLLDHVPGVEEKGWWKRKVISRITEWHKGVQELDEQREAPLGSAFAPRAEEDLVIRSREFFTLFTRSVRKHLPWWEELRIDSFAPGRTMAIIGGPGSGKTSLALLIRHAPYVDMFPVALSARKTSSFDEVLRGLQKEGARNLLRFLRVSPEQLLRLDGLALRRLARCLLPLGKDNVIEVLEVLKKKLSLQGAEDKQEQRGDASIKQATSAGVGRLKTLVKQAEPYDCPEEWMAAAQEIGQAWGFKVRWLLDDADGLGSTLDVWPLMHWLLRWRQWGHEVWFFFRPESAEVMRGFLVPMEEVRLAWNEESLCALIRARLRVVWQLTDGPSGTLDSLLDSVIEPEAIVRMAQWLLAEGASPNIGRLAKLWSKTLQGHPDFVKRWERHVQEKAQRKEGCQIPSGAKITKQAVEQAIQELNSSKRNRDL